MSSVLQQLITPGFRSVVYLGNALWHSSAAYHFALRPAYMMRKLSTRKHDVSTIETAEGDGWHHDLLRYLGAINVGYAALALLRFIPLAGVVRSKGMLATSSSASNKEVQAYLDIICLSTLGLANLSQALCNFIVARSSQRWIVGKFQGVKTDRITILDSLFTVLDFAIVGVRMAGY